LGSLRRWDMGDAFENPVNDGRFFNLHLMKEFK
jgi:hypothetical protein